MSNFKRNYLPGRVAPFDSSKRFARDRIMNNVNDAMEGNILSAFRRTRFKGVILNGYDTGVLKSTGDGYLFNAPTLVDLGDGLSRWKVNFTIHEDHYDTNIGNAFTSYYGVSPLLANVPPAQMQERINRMPFAYTDIGNSFYSNLHFGSVVNIYERFGYFFVGEPIGSQVVGGYSGPGSTRGGFSGGEPVSNVVLGAGEKQKISEFIKKLKASPSFSDFTAQSLAGVVSNARSETGGTFRSTIGGDPPSYWLKTSQEKYNSVVKYAVKGYGFNAKKENFYCSWGYWQLQICTKDGSGRKLAESKGIDTLTEEGKKAWADLISVDENQFAWVSSVLRGMQLHTLNDASLAGFKICYDFERPASKDTKCKERGAAAEAIYKEYKDLLSGNKK